MSFLLPCPNCGTRSVYEFTYGGELRTRPRVDAPAAEWVRYVYWKENTTGVAREWWFHRQGCRLWFVAERNATTNEVRDSYFYERSRAKSGDAPA